MKRTSSNSKTDQQLATELVRQCNVLLARLARRELPARANVERAVILLDGIDEKWTTTKPAILRTWLSMAAKELAEAAELLAGLGSTT